MNESGFQPARDISTIRIQTVVDTLDRQGMDDIQVNDSRIMAELKDKLNAFRTTIGNQPENIALKDLG